MAGCFWLMAFRDVRCSFCMVGNGGELRALWAGAGAISVAKWIQANNDGMGWAGRRRCGKAGSPGNAVWQTRHDKLSPRGNGCDLV